MSMHLIYGFDVGSAAEENGTSGELRGFDHRKLAIAFENPHPPGSYERSMAEMTNRGPERLVRLQGNGDDFYLGVGVDELPATISLSQMQEATRTPEAVAARERFERWWMTSSSAKELREATGIDEDVLRDFHAFDDGD